MSRDVHGLALLFFMPSVFVLVMSLALRDTFDPPAATQIRWACWDGANTADSAAFIARLPASKLSGDTHRASAKALEAAVRNGEAQVGIFIEPEFGKANPPAAPVLRLLAEPALPPALFIAFRGEVSRVLLEGLTSGPLPKIETAHAANAHSQAPLTAVQQSVPAWLVFGMFFVVIPVSTLFISEKQHGTFQRLLTLRVPVWLMLVGKVLPFHAVNLVQTALMMLVGRVVVPWCGGDALNCDVNLPALWLIATATSLAAICFALVVASFVRTTEQATTLGGAVNIVLAALGGVMVPKIVMPEAMQAITAFSPMAWGLDGFVDVFARGAGAAGVAKPAALLLVIAAFCFVVAWSRLRSSVRTLG